uniref:Reverse transcriptase domain-containing protein n=1 Tax=Peronospora matthiolae TaxID=2874970 RepID=A0AAV1UU64_9STRA
MKADIMNTPITVVQFQRLRNLLSIKAPRSAKSSRSAVEEAPRPESGNRTVRLGRLVLREGAISIAPLSCPLAPLLFLVVVELLGIVVQQSPTLKGLPVPGSRTQTHLFSAFVDDSTIFLEQANQLAPALALVSLFGALSGLEAQPSKSKIILLNTGVQMRKMVGISVLHQTETDSKASTAANHSFQGRD